MDAGGIQRVITVLNAHETGALFKRLRTQLGYLKQLLSVGKAAVCLTVFHNIFGYCLGDAGNVFQQGGGGGVQIHAHAVYAVFHHAAEGFSQLFWFISC